MGSIRSHLYPAGVAFNRTVHRENCGAGENAPHGAESGGRPRGFRVAPHKSTNVGAFGRIGLHMRTRADKRERFGTRKGRNLGGW
jgi:hypothetical protein